MGGFRAKDHYGGMIFFLNYMTSSSDPMRGYFGSQYFWILG